MNEFLNKIAEFLSGRKISLIEEKRLNKDLDAVFERLSKREYQRAGFSNNKFDIQDRTREFFTYLDFYCFMGKTWARVLKKININRYKQVVDLCPGYTPKVELALFYLGYKGEIMLLDQENSSTKQVEKFMQLFNPKYKIKRKKINLFGDLKDKYQIIIGNHIIDDLVIDYFCKKTKIKPSEVYEKEGKLVEVWKRIFADKKNITKNLVPKISKIFEKLMAKNGLILIAQYQSYIERMLDLKGVNSFNKNLLKEIAKTLCSKNFTDETGTVKESLRGYKGHFSANEIYVLKKVS